MNSMDQTSLYMVRRDLKTIPDYRIFDDEFTIRLIEPDEQREWPSLTFAAGEFTTLYAAIERFKREFGPHIDEFYKRNLVLTYRQKTIVGTATAWFSDDFRGQPMGRLHYFAIHPDFQGKNLARPLLCATMRKLAEFHTNAYLSTQPRSVIAIRLYLEFGFHPLLSDDSSRMKWLLLKDLLPPHALDLFDGEQELP